MKSSSNISNRMKEYERVTKSYLMKRTPVIVRLDGVAFHTFTKGMRFPFDNDVLLEAMRQTMLKLCESVPGCVFGYTQSDEITLVLTDYKTLSSSSYYDYVIQKLCSVLASKATLEFNKAFADRVQTVFGLDNSDEAILYRSKLWTGFFDCRVFNLPKEEVQNNLYWRQFDATKNSISQLAQSYFSVSELYKKSSSDKQDMLMLQKGVNWNDLPTVLKRGTSCVRVKESKVDKNGNVKVYFPWKIDREIPIFTKDWNYITDRVYFENDFSDM